MRTSRFRLNAAVTPSGSSYASSSSASGLTRSAPRSRPSPGSSAARMRAQKRLGAGPIEVADVRAEKQHERAPAGVGARATSLSPLSYVASCLTTSTSSSAASAWLAWSSAFRRDVNQMELADASVVPAFAVPCSPSSSSSVSSFVPLPGPSSTIRESRRSS